MSFQTFLLLMASTQAARAAVHNGSFIGRTFVRRYEIATDEPLDPGLWEYEHVIAPEAEDTNNTAYGPRVKLDNRSSVLMRNHSIKDKMPPISDEAQYFLTSPLSTIFIPSLYSLICLISVPLNAIALVIFAFRIRPIKPAVIFMMNLACADLLFALLLPFKISYHFSGNNWMFGPLMCRVVTAAFYCNMYCSVLLIACISVDRLLAVVYPIDSLAWRRPWNAAIACAVMWVLALCGSVPLVLSEQTSHLKEMNITTCHDVLDLAELQRQYIIYFPTISCLLFFLPLFITAVCYSRVIWSLSRVSRGLGGHSRRKARAMVMALNVMVLFVVCFTPTNVLLMMHYLQLSRGDDVGHQEAPDGTYAAYLVCLCVGSVNCCLDPLVYYFGSSQCQRQLASVFGCGRGLGGGNILHSTSHSSRSSSKTILKSSLKSSSGAKAPVSKMDSYQASLSSQYKKLLV